MTLSCCEAAYQKGDWDEAIRGMLEVIKLEPEAADTYYYLGEVYRLKGDYGNALQAYQGAIEKNQEFGPGYVGMARARLASDPNADVLSLLDNAIALTLTSVRPISNAPGSN